MFQVLPIQTKEEQEELAKLCHVPFRTEMLAYKALNEGVFKGMCQFTLNGQGGRIVDFGYVEYDFEPLFVMGRAALNFIDLCGVHKAFFDSDLDNETLIRAIGFRKNGEGRWEMDLTDFFNEPCKHTPKD